MFLPTDPNLLYLVVIPGEVLLSIVGVLISFRTNKYFLSFFHFYFSLVISISLTEEAFIRHYYKMLPTFFFEIKNE